MGKVLSLAIKPFRNYNIESRAHKMISKDKPIVAPKYKSDMLDYERIVKDHPDVVADSLKKHSKLDQNLRDVYVRSHDPVPVIETKIEEPKEDPDRRLPLDRKPVEDFEFGLKEPIKVPLGKITLRKVLRFISEHQVDPKVYNSTKIAEEYSLPEEKVKDVLKYCKVYEVYIPQQRQVQASFAGPAVTRRKLTAVKPKQLLPGKEEQGDT